MDMVELDCDQTTKQESKVSRQAVIMPRTAIKGKDPGINKVPKTKRSSKCT